jgi:hypothetical protein
MAACSWAWDMEGCSHVYIHQYGNVYNEWYADYEQVNSHNMQRQHTAAPGAPCAQRRQQHPPSAPPMQPLQVTQLGAQPRCTRGTNARIRNRSHGCKVAFALTPALLSSTMSHHTLRRPRVTHNLARDPPRALAQARHAISYSYTISSTKNQPNTADTDLRHTASSSYARPPRPAMTPRPDFDTCDRFKALVIV